ncbi:hypothetical protein ACJX0J_034199, partial [Zea mays]
VLGVIIQVHELTPTHIQSQLTPVLTRIIIIEDLRYCNPLFNDIITLWADQATSFGLHDVYDPNTKKNQLSCFFGGSACRWYFNPTILEAEPYHTSQQTRTIALQLPHALNHPPTIEHKQAVESKSLYDLIRINPYDFLEIGYECTVTITEIPVENKWWYSACTKCFKASTPQNTVYHCNDYNWDKYTFRQQSLPVQAQNLEQQGPSTPPNTSKLKLFKDSPSKLSMTTSTVVRYLFNQKIIQPTNIDITDAENDDIDEGNIE